MISAELDAITLNLNLNVNNNESTGSGSSEFVEAQRSKRCIIFQ